MTEEARFWLIVAFIVTLGGIGIGMSIRQSSLFHDDCSAAGGHVVDTHAKGNSRICVSEDGRIIEVGLR